MLVLGFQRNRILAVPFPRYRFKGIGGFLLCGYNGGFNGLFLFAGVNPLGKQFFGLFMALAGIFQANGRVGAKAD